MNENSSTHSSTSVSSQGVTAERISRRAYELWEKEGRPEGRDLHHWHQAEQELATEQPKSNQQQPAAKPAEQQPQRPQNTDTQPLQGTRAAAAANRPQGKRASASPFPSNDKSGQVRNGQSGPRTRV